MCSLAPDLKMLIIQGTLAYLVTLVLLPKVEHSPTDVFWNLMKLNLRS
jgi:hypothetical protein